MFSSKASTSAMEQEQPDSETGAPNAAGHTGDGSAPYRDALITVRMRVAELLADEQHRLGLVRAVEEVRVARRARRAAGIAGLVGLATGAAAALATWGRTGVTTLAVVGGAALALVTWAIARGILPAGVHARLAARLRSSGDPFADLARLEADADTTELLDETRRLEVSSVALPMVAKSLLVPLVLHFFFALFALAGLPLEKPQDFDGWIVISAMIVGHSHLLLAGLSIRFARRLQRGEQVGSSAGWWAWLWVTLSSLVPGAVFYAIPPAIVAVTGMLFIPLMFFNAREKALQERGLIEALATSRDPA